MRPARIFLVAVIGMRLLAMFIAVYGPLMLQSVAFGHWGGSYALAWFLENDQV